MSQLSEILPKDYGYVVLAVAGGTLVNADHFRAVAKARKEFRIKVNMDTTITFIICVLLVGFDFRYIISFHSGL